MKRWFSLPWRKWFKHLFVTAHFLLYSAVLIFSAILYIAFRPDGLHLVNTYFLKPLGINYSHAEGSLLEGFTLHNLRTENTETKTFILKYNLVKMIEGEHTIDSVKIDGLRLHLDDFLSEDDSIWPFPTFKLREVTITNLQLISSYPIELDIYGKNGTYDGDNLSFASLNATLKSRYASGAIHGTLRNNALSGISDIYPNAAELTSYSGRFTTLPRVLRVNITELSNEKAILRTNIAVLHSKQNPEIQAKAITLDFNYLYENGYFNINALYSLVHRSDAIQTKQHLRYALEGRTSTEFEGKISSVHPLPSNILRGEFTDDTKGLIGKLTLDGSTLYLSSKDYDRFNWKIQSNYSNLAFVKTLPKMLRSSPLRFSGEGSYLVSTDTLNGKVDAAHSHALFSGSFSTRDGHHALDGNLTLPSDAPMWKNWAHKPPKHLNLSINDENNATHIHLAGDSLSLSTLISGVKVTASGNYLGAFFDITGSLGATQNSFDVETLIPSVFATLSKVHPMELYAGEYYDGEIRAKTHISLGNTLRVQSDIKIPWYAAVLDSKRAYGGTDGSMRMEYRDGKITVTNYRFEIADHIITTDKTSYLHLSPEGELIIDEWWILTPCTSVELLPQIFVPRCGCVRIVSVIKGPKGMHTLLLISPLSGIRKQTKIFTVC